MREIKYRAWDRIDHRMRYEDDVEGIKEWPSLLVVGFNGRPICIDSDSFDGKEIKGWDRNHNLILMQYTGLKDKNGKEIYEGDILKCKVTKRKFSDSFDWIGETITFYKNSVVEWWESNSNIGYRLNNKKGHTMMIIPSSLKKMEVEVIGNIYADPNLLGEQS